MYVLKNITCECSECNYYHVFNYLCALKKSILSHFKV